jgi:hypothetical protein
MNEFPARPFLDVRHLRTHRCQCHSREFTMPLSRSPPSVRPPSPSPSPQSVVHGPWPMDSPSIPQDSLPLPGWNLSVSTKAAPSPFRRRMPSALPRICSHPPPLPPLPVPGPMPISTLLAITSLLHQSDQQPCLIPTGTIPSHHPSRSSHHRSALQVPWHGSMGPTDDYLQAPLPTG